MGGPPTLVIPDAPSTGIVTFYSRHPNPPAMSWFGHVWIRIEGVGTYGFYPRGVLEESAAIADLSYKSPKSKKLNRAVDVLRSYSNRPYNLVVQNCIDLCRETAEAIGLNAPSGFGKGPSEWLGDLAAANL